MHDSCGAHPDAHHASVQGCIVTYFGLALCY